RVLAALHRGAQTVAGVQDLVHQTLGHRLLTTLTRVADQPAQGQGGGAVRLHLDRDLVGRTTDAAALDLQRGADVVQGTLERGDGVGAGLGTDTFHGAVDDGLGDGLLAVHEDLVDELGDQGRPVDGVGDQRTLGSGALTRHYFF